MVMQAVRSISLTIGGGISATLPNSVREATTALEGLRSAQSTEINALKDLNSQIRQTAQGTEEYARLVQERDAIRDRTDQRARDIRNLNVETRKLNTSVSDLKGRLFGAVAGFTAIAGAVVGLSYAISRQSRQLTELSGFAIRTSRSYQQLERSVRSTGIAFGDIDFGAQAVRQAADLQAALERTLALGTNEIDLEAIQLSGIDIGTLRTDTAEQSISRLAERLRELREEGNQIELQRFVVGLRATGLEDAVSQFAALSEEAREISRIRSTRLRVSVPTAQLQAASAEIAAFTSALSALASSALSIASPAIQYFAGAVTTILTPVANVVGAFAGLVERSELLRRVLGTAGALAIGLASAFFAVRTATIAWQLATTLLNSSIVANTIATTSQSASTAALIAGRIASTTATVASTAATIASTVATGAATAAQWALNVALTANPIGLVVIAIAALVGGFVLLYKNSETVRNAVSALWGGIKGFASTLIDLGKRFAPILLPALGPIGLIISAVLLMIRNFDRIKAVVSGVADSIRSAFAVVADFIETRFGGVLRYVRDTIDAVKGAINFVRKITGRTEIGVDSEEGGERGGRGDGALGSTPRSPVVPVVNIQNNQPIQPTPIVSVQPAPVQVRSQESAPVQVTAPQAVQTPPNPVSVTERRRDASVLENVTIPQKNEFNIYRADNPGETARRVVDTLSNKTRQGLVSRRRVFVGAR